MLDALACSLDVPCLLCWMPLDVPWMPLDVPRAPRTQYVKTEVMISLSKPDLSLLLMSGNGASCLLSYTS